MLLIISNIVKILAFSLFPLNQTVIKSNIKTTQQVIKLPFLIEMLLTFLE